MCIISKLPNRKSTGYDNISTETIKIRSAVISPTLSLVINMCIMNSTVPDEIKVLKIKPLFCIEVAIGISETYYNLD